jgi:cell division protein FtsI (penicillin-binding protein 3)
MPAKGSRSPRRLVAIFLLFGVAFSGMAVRLMLIQTVQATDYARLAAKQRERVVEFPARRGTIFDRDGDALAVSVDLHTVYTDPALVESRRKVAGRLARALDVPRTEIASRLAGTGPGDRFEYIARQVQPDVAARVKRMRLPGIFLRTEPKRLYPGGSLASHVVGFVDIDGRGLSGVELQYDDILQGRPGRMTLEQDPEGRSLPQAETDYTEPRPGRSLFLSIDKQIQYFTEHALAEGVRAYSAAAGTAIVMRPSDGQVLAMANVPNFDPNNAGEWPEDAHRNRAVTDIYEPGSAFKAVTASAAIDRGAVSPRTTFVVPDTLAYSDRVFHDSHSHATEQMTVTEIIEQSSNVGTIKMGLELGGDALDRYVRRFGFGSATGLDFPAEASGSLLDREEWSGSTAATVPIGQGIAVTPMQMASAYATIANDGVWVEPKLLFATVDAHGRADMTSAPARRRVISRETAAAMRKILKGVVVRGTGINAVTPGYEVAGKTGTAQKPENGAYGNSYVGSFAGFAPLRDPQVVVLVMLDEPYPIWGGLTAAPVFAEITEFALRRLGVPPTTGASAPAQGLGDTTASDSSVRD